MSIYHISDKKNFSIGFGVYRITFLNSESGKSYIGSTIAKGGFRKRWLSHLSQLKIGKHPSSKLRNAYNKYGLQNIVFEILEEENINNNNILEREQFFINAYDSFNYGYNCRPQASNFLGFRHTEETKQHLSDLSKRERYCIYLKAIDLYNQGLNLKQISKILNIHSVTISKALRENGVEQLRKRADYIKVKIYQYNLNGEFISEWPSIYECAEKLNICESSIRKVLTSKTLHTYKFIFFYEQKLQEDVLYDIKQRREAIRIKRSIIAKSKMTPDHIEASRQRAMGNNYRKKIENIYQYDLNGILIKKWSDSKEIVDFFNLSNFSQILRVLKGERKQFRKFKWSLLKHE